MRALRIFLILVIVLGGLFVIADRVAVNFAEDQAADRIKSTEGLANTPDVSIEGFPFLTQVVGGELDDVKIGIKDYEASTGTSAGDGPDRRPARRDARRGLLRRLQLRHRRAGHRHRDDRLRRAAEGREVGAGDVAPGLTARITGLSDGGDGKIKVTLSSKLLGRDLPPVSVLSSVTVSGDTVKVHADSLPKIGGVQLVEGPIRSVTDFEQKIQKLPGGIKLDKVEAAPDGVDITVKGSDVSLVG